MSNSSSTQPNIFKKIYDLGEVTKQLQPIEAKLVRELIHNLDEGLTLHFDQAVINQLWEKHCAKSAT